MPRISIESYIKMTKLNVTCVCGHTVDSYISHCIKKEKLVNYTSKDCHLCITTFRQN